MYEPPRSQLPFVLDAAQYCRTRIGNHKLRIERIDYIVKIRGRYSEDKTIIGDLIDEKNKLLLTITHLEEYLARYRGYRNNPTEDVFEELFKEALDIRSLKHKRSY